MTKCYPRRAGESCGLCGRRLTMTISSPQGTGLAMMRLKANLKAHVKACQTRTPREREKELQRVQARGPRPLDRRIEEYGGGA